MANLSNINNKFLVTTGGNVGINSTGPNEKLEVGGSIRIDNGASFTSYQVYRDNIKYGDVGGGGNQFTIQASNNKNINLFDDSGVGLTVKDGGNVGIGTDSPDYHLEIENASSPTIALKDTTNNVITKMFSANSQGFVGTESNHDLRIRTNNTDKLTILSGGNVGIGTILPQSKLHIQTDAAPTDIYLTDGTVGTDNYGGVVRGFSVAGQGGRLQLGTLDNDIYYPTITLLQQGGNVGIGTILPTSKLTIDNGSAAGGSLLKSSSSDYTAHFIGNTGTGSAGIYMDAMDGDFIGSDYGFIGQNNAGYIEYTVSPNSPLPYHYFAQDVGIGTTSPAVRLDFGSTTGKAFHLYTSGTDYYGFNMLQYDSGPFSTNIFSGNGGEIKLRTVTGSTSAVTRLTVKANGDVGIGTTLPQALLDVNKTSSTIFDPLQDLGQRSGTATIHITNQDTTVGSFGQIMYDSDGSNQGIARIAFVDSGTASVDTVFVNENNNTKAERMRIRSNGNVGIGTASPASKLTVSGPSNAASNTPSQAIVDIVGSSTAHLLMGTASVSPYGAWINTDATGQPLVLQGTGGNVGIGTNSPTQKLDVNGQMTHNGLVLKTGTSVYIDTIQTIDKTLSITGGVWTNTGIEGTDIGANGSYMIQVYSNAHGTTGGAWYSMYWTGVMSWYKDSSNGINASEIYLNFSGHALNSNVLQLRTVQHTSSGTPANLMSLEIKTSNTLTNAPISFRFRRLM